MTITAHQFRRALEICLLAASNDRLRSVLQHVRFQPEFVEATDGHRCVRVEMPSGFIERTGCATTHAVKRYVAWLRYEPSLHVPTKFPGDDMLPFSEVTWPDTARIWPKEFAATAFPVGFKADYLGDLAKIARLADVPGNCVRVQMGKTEMDAALFTLPGATLTTQYLLMPMRLSEHIARSAA